jgi:hypothetical protein
MPTYRYLPFTYPARGSSNALQRRSIRHRPVMYGISRMGCDFSIGWHLNKFSGYTIGGNSIIV